MLPAKLRLAGYVSLFNALITLPVFFYSLLLEGNKRAISSGLQLILISAGCTAIAVFLMVSLRKYVLIKKGFDSIKKPILFLIIGYLISFVLSTVNMIFPSGEKMAALIAVVSLIILGLLQVHLGIRLFHLDHSLNGFRKPYSILLIVTGLLTASIALSPIAMFSSAVSDIMLGTIFLQAAKEMIVAKQPDR